MKPYYQDIRAGITIYHGDCCDILPWIAQQYVVDLVLADPPYGTKGNADQQSESRGGRKGLHGGITRTRAHQPINGDDKPYDPTPVLKLKVPTILWGANYYADRLPASRCWLVWDKRDGTTPDDNADCELAWTNFEKPARLYRHLWRGVCRASEAGELVLHPSQKPTALMRWCLVRANLKPGSLVVDPYMGSGPVAQACKEMGYRYIGIELVEDYVNTAISRLQQEVIVL